MANEGKTAKGGAHPSMKPSPELEHLFESIVMENQPISTVFQPVIALDDAQMVGAEALSRGPKGPLSNPTLLFEMAEALGRSGMLDYVCVRRAVASHRIAAGKLFVNVLPTSLVTGPLTAEKLRAMAEEVAMEPEQVVLEVSEEAWQEDLRHPLLQILDQYRQKGFQIAIDNVKAGQMSLDMMAAWRPDFLKVDIALIHGARGHQARELLIESLVYFADQVGSRIIAEGIESQEDLDTMRRLGVGLGQGYLWGRPTASLTSVHKSSR